MMQGDSMTYVEETKKSITVRLPKWLYNEIKFYAEQDLRSVNAQVVRILLDYYIQRSNTSKDGGE